jgi:hypothetical protein
MRMRDLPEIRDLFYPCDVRRVTCVTGDALLIGHDLEADILATDDGAVVARLDDRTWLINRSREAYGQSLHEVGKARDALAARVSDDEACVDALEARL